MKVLMSGVCILVIFFVLLVATLLMAMGTKIITAHLLSEFINYLYQSPYFSTVSILIGILLAFIGFLALILLERACRKEKNVVLNNKEGKISMAISAVEDIVRKVCGSLLDIKEIKPKIVVRKKGIKVIAHLVLFSSADIPRVSSDAQRIIKEEVEKSLGIEEEVKVEIYIDKIVEKSSREKKKEEMHIR